MPPPPELAWLTDKAVLWLASGYSYRGQPKTDDSGDVLRESEPEEINCRWEATLSEGGGAQRMASLYDARVRVDRFIPEGSILWKGDLADWYGTGSGDPDGELMRVVKLDESKDLKGKVTGRIVGLKRYRGSLPESS